MIQSGSEPFRLRFVSLTLVILFLLVVFPGHAVAAEDSVMDDAADNSSMLESAPDDGAETSPLPAAKIIMPKNAKAALQSAMDASKGQLTPGLRAAYVDWSKETVLTNLVAAKCSVPADCLSEVLSNTMLRDAMFATVYPPDPSILQNYAQLRSELGAGFMAKYRSLVVGIAVAKRVNGLLGVSAPAPPPSKKTIRQESAAATRAAENARLAEAVAGFMRKKSVSALDLYTNADTRGQLAASLDGKDFTATQLAAVGDPGQLFEPLKEAMVRLGQRPAKREDFPSMANWLRHLAAIYEATPTSTPPVKKGGAMPWPLFPMDRAPWPLLMPLARSLPLGEANYIWENFQGQHGGQRYHTYGPYKGPEGVRPLELLPSPWHWNAWPDRIVHGGKCVTMSGIAIDTHVALCEPSVGAGQPGHANLISFYGVGDLWNGVVEQAYAGGPDVTHAAWPFRDLEPVPARLNNKGAGAEYHLGLAQAMNVGLARYLDTRIAVNLFHLLPDAERKTIGVKLLVEATRINPFNPEPWYLLANQAPDAVTGMGYARYVVDIAGSELFRPPDEAVPANVSLEKFVEAEHPKPVENQIRNYWRTLDEYVVQFAILRFPVPADAKQARPIYLFLKNEAPGISAADQMPYRLRFEGGDVIQAELVNKLRLHLQAKGKAAQKGVKPFAAELHSYLAKASPLEQEQFLAALRSLIPRDAVDDPFLQAINTVSTKVRKKK